MKTRLSCFVFLFLRQIFACAQTDSIPQIEVKARRWEAGISPPPPLLLDSSIWAQAGQQSVADVLLRESHFFVKSYGAGGLATLSGRGGSAAQTAIVWEGISLQNPMLGQADLSLIPALWVDEAAVHYADSDKDIAANAPAGALYLQQKPPFGQGLRTAFGVTGGSFGRFQQQAKIQYGSRLWAVSSRLFFQTAQNDFPFRHPNLIGKPLVRQSNAALSQGGILAEYYLRPAPRHQLTAKTWFQRSHRDIPPSLLQLRADDHQFDQQLRQIIHWQYEGARLSLSGRLALLWDQLDYTSAAVQSNSQSWTTVAQTAMQWRIHPRHCLHSQAQYTYQQASSSGYSQSPQQHSPALRLGYRASFPHWALATHIQSEWSQGRITLPAFALQPTWSNAKGLSLSLSLAHQYRLPTLNDRYWYPSGNPLLRPEYSWNLALQGNWHRPLSPNHHLRLSAAAYSYWVRDWILWLPDPLSGLWLPDNVLRVWSRGLETQSQWQFLSPNRHWDVQLSARYAFNMTTDPQHRMLIYTPQHNAMLGTSLRYRHWSLHYQHCLVSRRYITTDNSQWLPLYHFGNLSLSYQQTFGTVRLTLFAQCQNIHPQPFQIISQRLVPVQQLSIGIRWNN